MKQSNNTDLVTAITAISLLKLLLLVMILTVLSGGDSYAFERKKYKVIVTRPGKNVTTQLRVYAEDEEEARENVALNGWQILSMEEVMDGSSLSRGADAGASFNMNITSVGNGEVEPMGDIQIAQGDSLQLTFKPGPCEKIDELIYNGQKIMPEGAEHTIDDIEKDGYIVAVFNENGSQCADNGILSKNLKEVGAVYFNLGKFSNDMTDEEKALMDSVTAGKTYVIIGHTDDVKVIPNSEYADNFQLSLKRAQYLLDKLKDRQLNTEGIKIIGLGPAFPAAPNKKEGQPLNRRAVLYERRD